MRPRNALFIDATGDKIMVEKFDVSKYYFDEDSETHGHIPYSEYGKCPGSAFLKFCGQAAIQIERVKDVRQVLLRDKKSEFTNELSKESAVPFQENTSSFYYTTAIQHFTNAMLASIMGNFETYQKHLFAGIFDRTQMLNFNDKKFFEQLGWKEKTVPVGIRHILSYRGLDYSMSPGLLIAENLGGWHDPERVNQHFAAFGDKNNNNSFNNVYSNKNIHLLRCLWQLRHSIVHTASTITPADALKVRELEQFAGRSIVFKNNIIYEVTAQMHYLVRDVNRRLKDAFDRFLIEDLSEEEVSDKDYFFAINLDKDGHPKASEWLS